MNKNNLTIIKIKNMSNNEIAELNKTIGIRLKAIRKIYNEGIHLSVEQFAHLLDISTDKLLNYESGRSALPINLLIELHNRGINPMFILLGSGDMFAKNSVGQALKKSILDKKIDYETVINEAINVQKTKQTHTIQPVIKAVAGEIK